MKKNKILLVLLALLWLLPISAGAASSTQLEHGVVFVLDASNSMNGNDRERLAIDSIAQLIYSLPSDYGVGFVAYNTGLVASTGMVDSSNRASIMTAANEVRYTGFTNAGVGVARAMELLDTLDAVAGENKTIVILSDGEILMQNPQETDSSNRLFQTSVERAKEQGVKIHVIGLGADMVDQENTIFSASAATGGSNYHAPKAADIQSAVDSILLEQLQVKKSTAAIVDTDGGVESVDVAIPSSNTAKVRVLFTSSSPIQNLKADFSAGGVQQFSGIHYTLLELDHPTADQIHVSFQGEAGSQVKIDVITEYQIVAKATVDYTDTVPQEEEATHYQRTGEVTLAFYDLQNPTRPVLTDPVFEGLTVTGNVSGESWAGAMQQGRVSLSRPVTEDKEETISISFDNLNTNILLSEFPVVTLEGPPLLPEPPDYRPYIAGGVVLVAGIGIAIFLWIRAKQRKKPRAVPEPTPPEPSKYSYTGRLSIYITRTKSGRDVPPLTYNLFRIPGGKVLSLQEVLDGCQVQEPMEGAEKIFFKAGANRCLVLANESDCTIMQHREILMKGRSYQLGLDSKVDITFEDEVTEMALQYREVRPSEMRTTAQVC